MTDSNLCTYCGRTGHTASTCKKRARVVAEAAAHSIWTTVKKPSAAVVAYKGRRPKRSISVTNQSRPGSIFDADSDYDVTGDQNEMTPEMKAAARELMEWIERNGGRQQ